MSDETFDQRPLSYFEHMQWEKMLDIERLLQANLERQTTNNERLERVEIAQRESTRALHEVSAGLAGVEARSIKQTFAIERLQDSNHRFTSLIELLIQNVGGLQSGFKTLYDEVLEKKKQSKFPEGHVAEIVAIQGPGKAEDP